MAFFLCRCLINIFTKVKGYETQMAEKKKKRKNKLFRVFVGLLEIALAVVLVIGLIGIYFYKSGEIALKASSATQTPVMEVEMEEVQRIRTAYENKVQETLLWQDNWVTYGDDVYEYNQDCLNFIVMGIDRSGELEKETKLSDWSAGQADAIFLLSLDNRNKKVSVIGIPRNSMIHVDIYNEQEECIDTIYNQICLQYGYAGGGELGLQKMKDGVSELMFNLPIHGACAVSYDAIGVVADRLGGIEVTISEDMTSLQKSYAVGSEVLLTGKNIIPYLRYRDNAKLGSPTTRLTRQKDFLKIAMAKAIQEIKEKPAIVSEIYQAIIPYMNTDITLDKAVYLAAEALEYSITDSSFYQLTGTDKQVDFENAKKAEDFYDDYYLDEENLKDTVIKVFYQKVVIEDD